MARTPAQLEDLIVKTHEDVSEIKIVLKGYNGQPGLCKQVECNTKAIAKIWVTLAVLIASAGGGTYGLVRLLLG